MHVQIVTFSLRDISDADYRSACDGLAKVLAQVPGLVWMAWLADEPTNTYGGVYTWVDRAAMEDYLHGDVFTAVAADPDLVNITSRDFELLEGPSRTTQAIPTATAVGRGVGWPGRRLAGASLTPRADSRHEPHRAAAHGRPGGGLRGS